MSVKLDANINIGNLTSATHKEVWFIYYRPQIQTLMSGSPDNHVAALLLMIACMDRVYTLAYPDKSGQRGYTQDMLKYFLPKPEGENDDEYDKQMKTLADDLVNALKHDSFIRSPNVMLSDAIYLGTKVDVNGEAIPAAVKGQRRIAVTWEDDGKLTIAATAFWYLIRDTIDDFYVNTAT